MNALVRKEIRLLKPSFLIGALTAWSIWTLPLGDKNAGFWIALRMIVPFVVCPAMVLMLALESFGGELNAKTFPQLLTQPVSRVRLWWTKVSLLAVATLLIWVMWYVPLVTLANIFGKNYFPWDGHGMAVASLLFLLTVFSGGLWTVLLVRQVGVAFWVTILIPFALLLGTYSQLDNWEPHRANRFVAIVFVVYGVVGFLFAQWLFLRAQDLQWSGGAVAIPKWRGRSRVREGAREVRRHRPWLAVITREVQLQQSQLIIAAFLIVLHLGAIAVRNFFGALRGHEIIHAVVHVFWVLWLLMPVLIGSAAIAEERKLGTLEGELCIPASRRFQFFAKLGVVLFLAMIFGVFAPTVLESIDGTRMLGNAHEVTQDLLPDFNNIILWYWIFFTPIAVGSALVAFYFSSLCRNTLQALGPSVLAILGIGFVQALSILPEETIGYPLWRGFIGDLIGLPVIGIVGLWLAYSNYRNIQRGWAVWTRNVGALVAAFVFSVGSAAGIYHRAWEAVLPAEQKHGPARLEASPAPELKTEMGSLAVALPDGQVWQGNFGYSLDTPLQVLMSDWNLIQLSGGSRFLDGTNWASVADCLFDTVAIRKDGTLWVCRKPLPIEFNRLYRRKGAGWQQPASSGAAEAVFERYGDASDWKSVVANRQYPLLLKTDGTLWAPSTNGVSVTNWPGLPAFALKQIGKASDWEEIRMVSSHYIYLRKKDGSVWSNVANAPGENIVIMIDQAFVRSPYLDGHDWRGLAIVDNYSQDVRVHSAAAAAFFNRYIVGVRDDGRFRLLAALPSGAVSFLPRDVQLNAETNWTGVEGFNTGEAVLLRADGTLWKWNLRADENASGGLRRLGAHSDWRALAGDGADLLALSADGSVWAWRKEQPWDWAPRELLVTPLIQVSRRAQFVANIFGTKP